MFTRGYVQLGIPPTQKKSNNPILAASMKDHPEIMFGDPPLYTGHLHIRDRPVCVLGMVYSQHIGFH